MQIHTGEAAADLSCFRSDILKGGCGKVAGHGHMAGAAYVSEKARWTLSIALMVVDSHKERFSFGVENTLGRFI